MAGKVAINGFGRIGRLVFRHIMERGGLEVAAVNDIAPLDNLTYLLNHDSAQAEPRERVRADDATLVWGDRRVRFLSEKDPAALPWRELGVETVLECSGRFTKREAAAAHLEAGAARVIISAPAKGPDITVCMGVNEDRLEPSKHRIISNASCTTNCLAPVVKVLDEAFGIENGLLTTVHAYTSSQAIVDAPAKKWRRGRAAAVNIVPTTTGAAIATTEVLPHLEGRLDGLAMRVPVPAGSIIDLVARTRERVTVESVNDAFRKAAASDRLRGILAVSDEELVSSDIVGTSASATVDAASTMVLGDRTVKVLAWYDNEWAYALRCVELASYIARRA